MIATEKLLLISCLFQGIICNELKAFMPQRIKALSGSCVLIPCTFTIEERLESAMVEPARGIWMTSYNFRDIVFDSSRHYGEKTLKAELLGKVTNKNCTTIINHLKRSDSKSYFFRADPPKYTFRENVRLEVVDSPDRPAISPSSAVKEGAPTSLACTAPAPCPREPPTLVWSDTLNGSVEIEQVEQQDGTKAVSSVLTFTASHLHHNKDITCTAQYPVGSESKSAGKVSTLHVLYSPKNTLVLINPSGEIHEGDHVTLSCSSNANPAVSRYTWFKVKGDNINEKSAEQNLTFTDINPSDSGLYYCEARNEHGAENSTAVQLNVAYSPKNTLVLINPSGEIHEGDHVTLSCSSNANPAVSRYTWFKVKGDNITEKSVEQDLTFTDINPSDSGLYYCEARNEHGAENSTAVQLNVAYSPKNTSVLINPSGEIHEGDHVTLSCSSNANPAVSRYTWFEVKGDNITEKSVEQYLTFTDINLNDSGLYYCEARNEHGAENSTAVQLNVAYPPKNTSVLINPSGEIHEGDHVTLSCSSNANPAVSRYTWFEVKGNNITEKSVEQNLTFTDINPSDSGLYYCEARNEHGTENSTAVQLNVACMPQISHESSCSKEDTESITCICVSRGSPSPITEWRIAGNKLENNTDRGSISNSKLEDHTMRSTLILLEPLAKNEAIQCLSKNRIGTASFQFHVFHEQKEGAEKQIHFLSAVYGGFACAAVLLLGFGFSKCVKKLMKSKSTSRPKREDTAELTEVNGLDSSSPQDEEENAIYANRPAATEDHQQGGQEENLHYASIDYSKLKPGNQKSGTKRASRYSTEYSEVKRPGTAGSEREVTDPPIEENEYAEMKGCPAKNRENTAAKSVSTGESDYAEVRRCHTSLE
ncbi:B-cell receptor CD22-like isoform X4 [Acipenser ruthenus]|uniref:B-cell receptor CD22-like isoform X4 n=1 Tax=Acipenser ruthenus TaxID=7906 RepID=UPI002741E7B0|nr:B-cell receptor CD22-like isoform X4 [Acipenser ruthenus]